MFTITSSCMVVMGVDEVLMPFSQVLQAMFVPCTKVSGTNFC